MSKRLDSDQWVCQECGKSLSGPEYHPLTGCAAWKLGDEYWTDFVIEARRRGREGFRDGQREGVPA